MLSAHLYKESLLRSGVGVFVGIQVGGFNLILNQKQAGPYTATGGSAAIASNRISYALGLEGPSMSIDTGCSSALVALDAACRTLAAGLCDTSKTLHTTALVASVNVLLSAAGYVLICQAHMLSPEGRCKTFDASANGYARAEGCCAIMIDSITASSDVAIAATAANQVSSKNVAHVCAHSSVAGWTHIEYDLS